MPTIKELQLKIARLEAANKRSRQGNARLKGEIVVLVERCDRAEGEVCRLSDNLASKDEVIASLRSRLKERERSTLRRGPAPAVAGSSRPLEEPDEPAIAGLKRQIVALREQVLSLGGQP